MEIHDTEIEDLFIVEGRGVQDDRGSFARLFCDRELAPVLGDRQIVQINRSITSHPGAIRGVHMQLPPSAEMKLVRCLRGRVFDVAVDLRLGSKTFLQYKAVELSGAENRMFVIPEGFAHGFQVLEENAELLYLHTAHYEPKNEWAIRYDDPRVGIDWPLEVTEISDRDSSHSHLSRNFEGLSL